MKKEFEYEEFEDFLKQSADGLRMKAPDAVWKKISKDLNKRRRRTVWGIGLALLMTSVAGYFAGTAVSDNPPVVSENNSSKPSTAPAPVVRMSDRSRVGSPAPNNSSTNHSITNSGPAPVVSIERKSTPVSITTSSPTSINDDEVILTYEERTVELSSDTNFINDSGASPKQTLFVPTVVDSYTEFDQPVKEAEKETLTTATEPALPLSIESVLNSFSRKPKARLETQLYFTPTVSYRKLSENKSYLQSLDPALIPANYPALTSSVNNNVTHKPDLGFEVGVAVKYPITEKLKLRGGIQFNVNRYEIRAYSSNWTMATIALNSNSGVDSLRSLSTYSNVNGYKANWLQNFSFQVSAPVGIEYNFGGSNKMQLGMAYTVQPTYVLNDRSYVITTDYKRYTQVPWLLRRWNLNTAFETFVAYQPGKTRWQLGPQVRYQLFSSFISEYPVKENLFDFGLKLGVSLGGR